MSIAFLGGGNMAGALVGGLLAKGHPAAQISVVEIADGPGAKLAARYAVHVSTAADATTDAADTLVLAVKPQDMRKAVTPLATRLSGKLVVSIAAGIRLADLARWLGGHRKLIRAMPNSPALIGAGITALCALPEVRARERERAEEILAAVGETVWLDDERLMDPVTAVSGSGPAYVFWFIEQLARAGETLGLAPQAARRLAIATALGAARLAAHSDEPPSVLRERVTSKGGTTEAALRVFADERLDERLRRAIEAASRRSAELGELLGRDD